MWPTFGSKVGLNVLIARKLESLWHRILDVYTKFQINILEYVEKIPVNIKKHKNNHKNSDNKIFT